MARLAAAWPGTEGQCRMTGLLLAAKVDHELLFIVDRQGRRRGRLLTLRFACVFDQQHDNDSMPVVTR